MFDSEMIGQIPDVIWLLLNLSLTHPKILALLGVGLLAGVLKRKLRRG